MTFKQSFATVGVLLAIMVGVQLLNSLTGGAISQFGIVPREISGLIGIPLAPWIHHSWFHLLANLPAAGILLFLASRQSKGQFVFAIIGISLLAGIGVWIFGSKASHAGASIMIFGLWGYLIALAVFMRQLVNILIALVVVVLYGGLMFSLLSFQPHISWAGHFFGLVAGIATAYLQYKSSKTKQT